MSTRQRGPNRFLTLWVSIAPRSLPVWGEAGHAALKRGVEGRLAQAESRQLVWRLKAPGLLAWRLLLLLAPGFPRRRYQHSSSDSFIDTDSECAHWGSGGRSRRSARSVGPTVAVWRSADRRFRARTPTSAAGRSPRLCAHTEPTAQADTAPARVPPEEPGPLTKRPTEHGTPCSTIRSRAPVSRTQPSWLPQLEYPLRSLSPCT